MEQRATRWTPGSSDGGPTLGVSVRVPGWFIKGSGTIFRLRGWARTIAVPLGVHDED